MEEEEEVHEIHDKYFEHLLISQDSISKQKQSLFSI